MKISFFSGHAGQKHTSRIMEILRNHAPQHKYNHCADDAKPDVWHCMAPHNSILFIRHAPRSVVSLSDVRFITEPEIFSIPERLFRFPIYRYHCRHAARLIAHNAQAKRRVVEALGVDKERVEVCMPFFAVVNLRPARQPSRDEMLCVRAKFELPDTYILIMGSADTMHDHGVILRAIFSLSIDLNVVIFTRHTTYSDTLVKMVRDMGTDGRVQFIYEASAEDMASIYRMALVMVYMPAFDSLVAPIVEALLHGVPMILSDTPLNCEAAGEAASYVAPHDESQLRAALKAMIYNESFRSQMIAMCWAEARRYSQEGIAEQLSKIYESV